MVQCIDDPYLINRNLCILLLGLKKKKKSLRKNRKREKKTIFFMEIKR